MTATTATIAQLLQRIEHSRKTLIEGTGDLARMTFSNTLIQQYGSLLTALQLQAYPPGSHPDERADQTVITVHGVDVSVHGRERDLFIRIGGTERDEDEPAEYPLVVDPTTACETKATDRCPPARQAGGRRG